MLMCRCPDASWNCPANGMVLDSEDVPRIEAQIEAGLEELRQEFDVSARRVATYAVVRWAQRQVLRIVLRGEWNVDR